MHDEGNEHDEALAAMQLEDEQARDEIAHERLKTPRARIALKGRFRFYFNHHGAAPLVWCVAPEDGEFEIAIRGFELRVDSEAVYRKKAEADEDDGRPSGWIACTGDLEIEDGIARVIP